MATSWADIVSAAMVQIDDVRLQEQLTVAPAQFYRRMAALIQQAMPLMCRPQELLHYLQDNVTEPEYADAEWTSTQESLNQETTVETGASGYELCSVVKVVNETGMISYIPYPAAQYNAETGSVTFPVQDETGVAYMIDFYKDGSFADLTPTQIRLFALAVAVIWDERFSRNWLNMQQKLKDDSFTTGNEANYIAQITKRMHDNRIAFNDELRSYEQSCAYANTMQYGTVQNTKLI